MRPRFAVAVLVVAGACLLIAPAAGSCAQAILRFGATYSVAGGEPRTHHGVDIAAQAGDDVTALADGTVKFAGRIPGADGGTVLVVSIECADGVVTAMPLSEACVAAGDTIARGEVLGSVAGSGDPSSAAPHIHYGLKRGTLYLDPSSLIAAAAATSPETEPETQAEPVSSAEAAPAAVARPAVETPGAPAGSPAVAPVGAAAGSPAPLATQGTRAPADAPSAAAAPHAIEVAIDAPAGTGAPASAGLRAASQAPAPAGEIAPGVSLPSAGAQPRAVNAAQAAPSGVLASGLGAAAAGGRAARGALSRLQASPRGIAAGVAALSASLFSCVLLFGLTALRRQIESNSPVSDRLGTMLQHLRAGDTLCGLTSCSGHSAFTDPGPPAQRR